MVYHKVYLVNDTLKDIDMATQFKFAAFLFHLHWSVSRSFTKSRQNENHLHLNHFRLLPVFSVSVVQKLNNRQCTRTGEFFTYPVTICCFKDMVYSHYCYW